MENYIFQKSKLIFLEFQHGMENQLHDASWYIVVTDIFCNGN